MRSGNIWSYLHREHTRGTPRSQGHGHARVLRATSRNTPRAIDNASPYDRRVVVILPHHGRASGFLETTSVDEINRCYRGEVYGPGPLLDGAQFDAHVLRNDIRHERALYANGHLLAIAHLGLRETRAWLGAFGVPEGARGRGHASVMLGEILRLAKSCGATTCELEVLSENTPARRLYERSGFLTTSTLDIWHRDPLATGEPTVSPQHERLSSGDIDALRSGEPACWQRESRSVTMDSALDVVRLTEKGYSLGWESGRGTGRAILRLVDADVPRHAAGVELLARLDEAYAGTIVLTNEPSTTPLAAALRAHPAWQTMRKQSRMLVPL